MLVAVVMCAYAAAEWGESGHRGEGRSPRKAAVDYLEQLDVGCAYCAR